MNISTTTARFRFGKFTYFKKERHRDDAMMHRTFGWPFSFYFLLFAGMATYRPSLVPYYQSFSFTGAQIGLLAGIATLITMISLPFITGFADRTSRHNVIMGLGLVVLIAGFMVYPSLRTFIPLLDMAVLSTMVFAPIMALSNSAAMIMPGARKDLFGRIRLGSTVGYSIAARMFPPEAVDSD